MSSLADFEVLSGLGKGAFACVDKVKRLLDNKVYALKRVKIGEISPKELEECLNEIRILASFRHPRIIRWYETFIESSTSELCIVMELCSYGDLEQKIQRYQQKGQYIDEREIWVCAINILEGLVALHAKGVVHRDLKPADCLIDQHGCVKIADMNISKVTKGGNMKTQVGTPYFMSPEIYLGRPYTTTSDIWALGGVLYALAALRPPFLAGNIMNLRKAVLQGNFDPLQRGYSPDLAAIINKFLQLHPTNRPEAKDPLQDPSIQSHRHLLLHPLLSGQDEVEGDLMPTIKVASHKNEGVKSFILPGQVGLVDSSFGAITFEPPSSINVHVLLSPGEGGVGSRESPMTARGMSTKGIATSTIVEAVKVSVPVTPRPESSLNQGEQSPSFKRPDVAGLTPTAIGGSNSSLEPPTTTSPASSSSPSPSSVPHLPPPSPRSLVAPSVMRRGHSLSPRLKAPESAGSNGSPSAAGGTDHGVPVGVLRRGDSDRRAMFAKTKSSYSLLMVGGSSRQLTAGADASSRGNVVLPTITKAQPSANISSKSKPSHANIIFEDDDDDDGFAPPR